MPQAPDPSVQLLKNNVLLGLNPFNVRRGQVILRIVAPKSRESSVLFVQDCKIISSYSGEVLSSAATCSFLTSVRSHRLLLRTCSW